MNRGKKRFRWTGRGLFLLAVVSVLAMSSGCAAPVEGAPVKEEPIPDVTTVEVTDNVLVEDTMRLGINTCGDNYWDSGIVKVRAAENFEGIMYRMISWGPVQDENGVMLWFTPAEEAWEAMKGRVRYTILGGPAKGTTGLVKEVQWRVHERDQRKPKLAYVVFDKQVPPSDSHKNGILLEYDNLDQGSIKESSNREFWNTEGNTAAVGDVPPGSFGCAALHLRGAEAPAHYTFVPMWASQAEQAGTWRIEFWAKAKAGRPKFRVSVEDVPDVPVEVGPEWRQHDLAIEVEGLREGKNVTIRLVASDGEVLVDDVVIWKEEEHRNPTPFRDPLVDLLKRLKPGVLRHLQMGGSNLENNLRPRLQQYGWTRSFANLVMDGRNNASEYRFNLHDYYVLCEYVGAEPWYCVPGTLHPDEVDILMEYLGAPADAGYGKVRAELGHPQPWTEVFEHIYVEFGNEAWNPGGYATGSFNGPDHWKDMMAVGKSSPHYRPNIVFVAGSQAGSTYVTQSVLKDVPNADRVAIAPYLMNGTRQEHVEHLKTDDDLFRWVFAYTIRRVLEPAGNVRRHYELTQAAGKGLSIYEHQFHITNPRPGEEGAVPMETRVKIITSIGGGLNIINDSLLMMRERGIRTQCLFNLNQKGFYGIPLWGFVPGINVQDQRYRPLFLAAEIANDVIGGDVVETVHSGQNPTFSATGRFEDNRGREQTYSGIPVLWSYAFKEGGRRGLVLFNLDTQHARSVRLVFPGAVVGGAATAWWLTADEITATNEPGAGEPQVDVRREEIGGFASGRAMQLPPFSMVALPWRTQ